ncbi:hypothetical protein NC651_025172 [Populus alba x Populus x berolinensis]|nr:hypothetical protein NC651_025172 [Populus alba x Populus x berolinensis]
MGRSLCFRTLFCVATSWELISLSILQSTDQCGTPGAIIGSALTICEKKRKSLVPKLPINIVIIK